MQLYGTSKSVEKKRFNLPLPNFCSQKSLTILALESHYFFLEEAHNQPLELALAIHNHLYSSRDRTYHSLNEEQSNQDPLGRS